MALSIKNSEAERLAAEVAKRTGENLTRAVTVALEERLERLTGRRRSPDLVAALTCISERCSALPDRDARMPDEILDYDEHGAFSSAS